jgi:hypothetical protein
MKKQQQHAELLSYIWNELNLNDSRFVSFPSLMGIQKSENNELYTDCQNELNQRFPLN